MRAFSEEKIVESWKKLFNSNNLIIDRITEPISQTTGKPALIIFVGSMTN